MMTTRKQHPFTTSTLIQTLPFPKDYIREDVMTVLNQVRPSSLSYQKSFSTRAICLGLGAADIVTGKALRRICSDASLPDWLEGGGGPLANTSSQEHGQLKSAMAKHGQLKSAMATGGQGRPEVLLS